MNSVTLYRKLRDYLAIWRPTVVTPVQRGKVSWSKRIDLVRWMPRLTTSYRRLTYEEFCTAYNLEMIAF